MAKEGPNWDGLLKWSLSHADATNPPRNLSEEDRKWFMEAMQAQTVDVVKRMKEITLVMQTPEQVLESQGVTSQDIQDMLDELQEHVESIDMANDLHSIGGLVPLLGYLKNAHANIRAKAAEVVSTIVQNNPRSQQLVMEANGLEPLLSNFTSDPDVTARTKALGAISSLIRHNKPGIAAFRLANGYAALRDALSSESPRFQRKALNLIHYLLHENRSDCNVVTELGFPRVLMHLASSEDGEVREGALRGLLELAKDRTGEDAAGSSSIEENEKLKQILLERIEGISSMSPEDLGAAKEERQLVDSLWNTCYNEPSSLREKGLVVLPGDDASPPPDVASKHFEPPLRAWAANRYEDNTPPSNNEKKQAPLLIGLGPPPPRNSSSGGGVAGEENNRDTST
ncbi:putative high-light-induced protein, chloroplastic-like [Capsicum annuum]|uniref:hsp70-binding protein 1 n=1 Tax=Capsicum annuum TaxID=4072 RepID=UPI0007BF95BA|nr:hsp70-binding protein 1 [Capsicum annuum]KAF3626208.1 putative high-light-induced protein, chloroplastic-like [Capsicum annuum]